MGFLGANKKERNILDIFTYDITTFFYGDYEEVDSIDTESMFMIVYERPLPWIEVGCFDCIQFRVFFDKENFTGSNPVNVRMYAKNFEPNIESIRSLINTITTIYGNDDDGNAEFNDNDRFMIEQKSFERRWTIEKGESFITIYYNEKGLELNILFLNNLIKHTGKYLNIK